MKDFIFQQKDRDNWTKVTSDLADSLRKFKLRCNQDFIVTIDKYSAKKSAKQLRSYWMLIGSVTDYMNEQGNNFTKEEVSDYFKLQCGHFTMIKNNKIPKSISHKSDTTKDQMQLLINTILVFGAEYEIQDCNIESYELQALLNNYK